MDVSNAVRQVEEILTLQDQFRQDDHEHAMTIKTPALFQRLQRISPSMAGSAPLDVKKCLSFDISCGVLFSNDNNNYGDSGNDNGSNSDLSDLIVSCEFPLTYPSESICRIRAISARDLKVEYEGCTSAIATYLQSFVGCECMEMALDWIRLNQGTCLQMTNMTDKNDGVGSGSGSSLSVPAKEGFVPCFILRYNHLLSGPEHKKEKSMMDTAKKSKLQGGLVWGTPGIVVLVPPTSEEDAREYASDCRSIGKRPDGVEEIYLPKDAIEKAGLGGLAQQKRGNKLQELDTAGMRLACGGDEDLLRHVLGVH